MPARGLPPGFVLIFPQVHADVFAERGEGEERGEIEARVAEGIFARQLQGLAAVGFELHADAFGASCLNDPLRQIRVTDEQGHVRGLRVIPGTVIVLGRRFVATVFARLRPAQESADPLNHPVLIRA